FALDDNRFSDAKTLAEQILKTNPDDPHATNIVGIAQFADHDFAGAIKTLSEAKEKKILSPEMGGRYLDFARKYVDYWKTEQEIRDKEARLEGDEQLPRVKLETSKGEIVLELFENEAPNTVANFVNLVEKKYYDGLKFHRVIPGFMAQGGCPHSRDGDPGTPGTGGPGYNISCECYRPDARRHFAGSLSMAHAGRDTGGSQFFITHLPTPHLDKEVSPQSVHTVFGRVVEGLDVARDLEVDDKIQSATVLRKRDHEYVPKTQPEF
ncbi:MAG: peptidylprolyl isomerase, partial [Planctomycetaceae bacterium]|nr:peptidylprolyl isomerase [Planctomycetaceae bacterium]